MSKKRSIIFLSILFITLLVVTAGVSYSYWYLTLTQTSTNEISLGCFNLEMIDEANEIKLENAFPILNEEGKDLTPYTFKIKNTCTTNAYYSINLEVLSTSTLESKYLEVMLDDNDYYKLDILPQTSVVDTSSKESRSLSTGVLLPNQEK